MTISKTWLAVIAGVILAALSVAIDGYIREVTAQATRDAAVKYADSQIAVAQTNAKKNADAAIAAIGALKREVSRVKTPAQAIPEIPRLTDLPLNARPVPEFPAAVAVDATPLIEALARGKESALSLDACRKQVDADRTIQDAQDREVKALKHPRTFWKNTEDVAIKVGIGVAIGFAVRH